MVVHSGRKESNDKREEGWHIGRREIMNEVLMKKGRASRCSERTKEERKMERQKEKENIPFWHGEGNNEMQKRGRVEDG